jgi:hypothetical protein
MMKKAIYFMTLMFAMVIMSTSCEKPANEDINYVKVSIATLTNPVDPGISVTFTATPTFGGTSPQYQWKVNGVNAGTNSPTYTYTPNNNDAVTCVLTSNASDAIGSPATSNSVTVKVNPITVNMLLGTWRFISLETTPTKKYGNTSADFVTLKNDGINYGALNLKFTLNPDILNIKDLCAVPADVNGYDYDVTINTTDNTIHCKGNQSDELVFKIKSLNSGKTELKLSLLSSKVVLHTPSSSAVYTFNK